jgi:hypothetical protein
MFEVDLSAGKGLLWLRTPKPKEDGTLFSARRIGPDSEAIAARRSDMFSHVAYGPSGDRYRTLCFHHKQKKSTYIGTEHGSCIDFLFFYQDTFLFF